ncbi:RHS repeat protein [Salmonella enterica]|nr:RHS repeat protein [Salmonella enterica]
MMTFMSLNLKIINNLSITEKFRQQANATFPPELVAMVDSLEADLQRRELSEPNRAWLAQGGLTPEQIQNQMEPEYTPQRKIHLYHCDHRGLPLALVNVEGKADWSAEYDAWGNMLRENNPHNLVQHIHLPGQQYDEETGLYYNRHRYYDPLLGRYITKDPIGLRGGWNAYTYPLNPITNIDPLGLNGWNSLGDGGLKNVCQQVNSAITYLPQNEAESVIHNVETMHNVPNPLGQYVYAWSIVPTLAGMTVLGGEVALTERAAACINDVSNSAIVDGERDKKELLLTCAKSATDAGLPEIQKKIYDFLFDSLFSYSQKQ